VIDIYLKVKSQIIIKNSTFSHIPNKSDLYLNMVFAEAIFAGIHAVARLNILSYVLFDPISISTRP